jgi:hypothetical protein
LADYKPEDEALRRRRETPFNTHLLRGIVASMLVRENDNGFEMARVMLSDRVIRDHYTPTANQYLIRKAQDVMQKVRSRTAPNAANQSQPAELDRIERRIARIVALITDDDAPVRALKQELVALEKRQ